MPDLTTQVFKACRTSREWSEEVPASDGGTYRVSFGPHGHKNPNVECDYSCTCPAYYYGKALDCKHIRAVKHHRCGYHEAYHTPDTPASFDGDRCPHCGGDLIYERIAG